MSWLQSLCHEWQVYAWILCTVRPSKRVIQCTSYFCIWDHLQKKPWMTVSWVSSFQGHRSFTKDQTSPPKTRLFDIWDYPQLVNRNSFPFKMNWDHQPVSWTLIAHYAARYSRHNLKCRHWCLSGNTWHFKESRCVSYSRIYVKSMHPASQK